jgi:hypothetical protein
LDQDKSGNPGLALVFGIGSWPSEDWSHLNERQPDHASQPLALRYGVESTFFRTGLKCGYVGCQMVYFETKNTNLGVFWRSLERKILVYLLPFGTVYGHLV